MFIADKFVSDMLWCMMEHSSENGVTEYRIPLFTGDFTKITGEWFWHRNKSDGIENGYFLVHSWNNEGRNKNVRQERIDR